MVVYAVVLGDFHSREVESVWDCAGCAERRLREIGTRAWILILRVRNYETEGNSDAEG